MEILLFVGAIALIVCLFAFLIYVFKLARRFDSLLEKYSPFFTKWQAYFYMTYTVMRLVVPLIFIGSAIALHFSDESTGTSQEIILSVVACVVGVVIGLLLHLLKVRRDKSLQDTYGPLAAKELAKAMMQVGVALATKAAWKMLKITGIVTVSKNVIIGTDGRIIPVLRYSVNEAIDADGNIYEYHFE